MLFVIWDAMHFLFLNKQQVVPYGARHLQPNLIGFAQYHSQELGSVVKALLDRNIQDSIGNMGLILGSFYVPDHPIAPQIEIYNIL